MLYSIIISVSAKAFYSFLYMVYILIIYIEACTTGYAVSKGSKGSRVLSQQILNVNKRTVVKTQGECTSWLRNPPL